MERRRPLPGVEFAVALVCVAVVAPTARGGLVVNMNDGKNPGVQFLSDPTGRLHDGP
ncbi:MAG: hypothetical protein U0804_19800 [Gemmataceae bacterium]